MTTGTQEKGVAMSVLSRVTVAAAVVAALTAGWTSSAAGQTGAAKKKVFIDQDGAALGTDMISTLAMLQAPEVEVLGIAVTAGDAWVKAGTAHMLRMLELTGHGNVPVAAGAAFPLINSREQTAAWEAQYGSSLTRARGTRAATTSPTPCRRRRPAPPPSNRSTCTARCS